MSWKRKRRIYGKNRYYSLSKKLARDNKTTPEFEVMLNTLTLEEVIGLKLELAAKASGSPLYGVPIWKSLRYIVNDAVLKYAYSASRTYREASRFLGIREADLKKLKKFYQIESFFEEKKEVSEEDEFY